jgi:hypothetical protein
VHECTRLARIAPMPPVATEQNRPPTIVPPTLTSVTRPSEFVGGSNRGPPRGMGDCSRCNQAIAPAQERDTCADGTLCHANEIDCAHFVGSPISMPNVRRPSALGTDRANAVLPMQAQAQAQAHECTRCDQVITSAQERNTSAEGTFSHATPRDCLHAADMAAETPQLLPTIPRKADSILDSHVINIIMANARHEHDRNVVRKHTSERRIERVKSAGPHGRQSDGRNQNHSDFEEEHL